MLKKDNFCSFCGTRHEANRYPKQCPKCRTVTYLNPLPVAVVLLPVGDELLVIRRNIPPVVGRLALPGGFIEVGETWQMAARRELLEETGIEITSEEIKLFDVRSAPDGTVLIFGLAARRPKSEIRFTENDETQEVTFIDRAVELAFPLHTEVVKDFFAG
jgi:ADP-ribose pyrophosphatase YjhB (NUDIX family)